jgi:hypothetical protein
LRGARHGHCGLAALGLRRYEAAFGENEIDEAVLPNLTAEDLKELGVASLWHRRKLLDAIGQQTRPRFKGWGDEHGQFDERPALVRLTELCGSA